MAIIPINEVAQVMGFSKLERRAKNTAQGTRGKDLKRKVPSGLA